MTTGRGISLRDLEKTTALRVVFDGAELSSMSIRLQVGRMGLTRAHGSRGITATTLKASARRKPNGAKEALPIGVILYGKSHLTADEAMRLGFGSAEVIEGSTAPLVASVPTLA